MFKCNNSGLDDKTDEFCTTLGIRRILEKFGLFDMIFLEANVYDK